MISVASTIGTDGYKLTTSYETWTSSGSISVKKTYEKNKGLATGSPVVNELNSKVYR